MLKYIHHRETLLVPRHGRGLGDSLRWQLIQKYYLFNWCFSTIIRDQFDDYLIARYVANTCRREEGSADI